LNEAGRADMLRCGATASAWQEGDAAGRAALLHHLAEQFRSVTQLARSTTTSFFTSSIMAPFGMPGACPRWLLRVLVFVCLSVCLPACLRRKGVCGMAPSAGRVSQPVACMIAG
jgi:hypothetical protein